MMVTSDGHIQFLSQINNLLKYRILVTLILSVLIYLVVNILLLCDVVGTYKRYLQGVGDSIVSSGFIIS